MLALLSSTSLPAWREVRHAVADATLVLSLLTGGCMAERPPPDDDDDDDGCGLDVGCEEEVGPDPDPPEQPTASSPGGGSSIPPSSPVSCCTSHFGVGCNDHPTESCVCGLDPACCTDGWDATCVMTAETFCSAACTDEGPWG